MTRNNGFAALVALAAVGLLACRAAARGARLPAGFRMTTNAAAAHPDVGWAKEITDEVTGMEFIYVPSGSFTMGSPENEPSRDIEEKQHAVTLTHGFYLGKFEVTQEQWEKVVGNNPSVSTNAGKRAPVEHVAWEDCRDFVRRLNRERTRRFGGKAAGSGLFRLPTEAEWEYACRAGTTGTYSGGLREDEICWYGGNSGGKPHPVGEKQPNAWGFYDMHGNVREWCRDVFGAYPSGSVTNPPGPFSGTVHVGRGGSVAYNSGACRSASRMRGFPGYYQYFFGCRVAFVPDDGAFQPVP